MSPHRFGFENHAHLVDEERERFQPSTEIIGRAEVGPEEVVADLGCGIGFLTLPLAKERRTVLALDVQGSMLDTLWKRADEEARKRVHLLLCELPSLPLRDGALDRVMMLNVLHEFEDKGSMVDECRRCLRPGGRLSLVDFQKRPTTRGPPLEERIPEEEVLGLFPGWELVNRFSYDSFYQFELRLPQ